MRKILIRPITLKKASANHPFFDLFKETVNVVVLLTHLKLYQKSVKSEGKMKQVI